MCLLHPLNNVDTRRALNLSQSSGKTMAIETFLTYNWSNDDHDINLMLGNSVSKYDGKNTLIEQNPGY